MIEELLEFAEHSFTLNAADKDGVSLKDHLEIIQEQTGVTPKELEDVPFPVLVQHIWSAFVSLSDSRSAGFSGPNALTYTEIKAWMELTNEHLSPRDIEAIKKLDTAYLRKQHE